jgi:hypothetical protein
MQLELGLPGYLMSGMGRLVSEQVGGTVGAHPTVGTVDVEPLPVVSSDFGHGPLPTAAVTGAIALLVQPAGAVVGVHRSDAQVSICSPMWFYRQRSEEPERTADRSGRKPR